MALAIGQGAPTQFLHRAAMADGREQIPQGAASPPVHEHLAHGHQGQLMGGGQFPRPFQQGPIPAIAQQGQGQPAPPGKPGAKPVCRRLFPLAGQQQQGQTVFQALLQVRPVQFIAALVCPAASPGDEPAKLPVAPAVARQQHQARAVAQADFRTDEQLQVPLLCFLVSAHHPGKAAFIGEGQGRIAQLRGAGHQFLGMGSAAQKAVVADAMQFRVSRFLRHSNTPCRYQSPLRLSRYTHRRCPAGLRAR